MTDAQYQPRSGDVVRIGSACGVQFRCCPIGLFSIATITRYPSTPEYMTYLSGYRLDSNYLAVEHRPELYVITAGLELVQRPQPVVRPRNASPNARQIPRQRTATTPTRRPR